MFDPSFEETIVINPLAKMNVLAKRQVEHYNILESHCWLNKSESYWNPIQIKENFKEHLKRPNFRHEKHQLSSCTNKIRLKLKQVINKIIKAGYILLFFKNQFTLRTDP